MLVPAGGTWNDVPSGVGEPMRTRTVREAEALVTGAATSDALISAEAFVAVLRNHGGAHDVAEPFRTMTAGGHHHALVIPYRKDNHPTCTASPLHTMATRDSAALVQPSQAVADCRFRMLKPREQLRAQRFPDTYTVAGNIAEQTMQAGNAVSANVAQWLAQQVSAALDGRTGS
jgi:DNA (cytosine-5)-methyltransferase 1